MDEKLVRERQITRTSIIGIIANAFLVVFKAMVGLLSGSIAIVLDAVNNLTDAVSSVITIVGIKLAKKEPDDDHPFGYGRIEYFSAILIAGIVLAAGLTSLVESVKKIFAPELPNYSVLTIVIIVVAIATKLVLGRYVKAQGEKYNSDALVASGADATFDAIISVSTLVGAVITLVFHISLDGIIGAVISCFIIKAGLEMLLSPVNQVVGFRPDSEITKDIKAAVRGIDGVIGAYDLVLHNYGPDRAIGSIHVEVDDTLTARQIHLLTKEIQLMVAERFKIFVTVGIYGVDLQNTAHAETQNTIKEMAMSHEFVLGAHGVFIDDAHKYISFDVLVDFNVRDRNALSAAITEQVHTICPGYTVDISYDTNYSD